MQVVIVAGGKGTRLAERTGGVPKPMVEIGGKPLLEHQVLLGRKYGFTDFLFLTGFGSEHIANYFGDGSRWSVRIRYQVESQPLGTAGAVLNAFEQLEDTFLVLYGDTMVNADFARIAAAHRETATATIFIHPNDHPQDSDLVELDADDRVVAFIHTRIRTASTFRTSSMQPYIFCPKKPCEIGVLPTGRARSILQKICFQPCWPGASFCMAIGVENTSRTLGRRRGWIAYEPSIRRPHSDPRLGYSASRCVPRS